MVLTVAAGSGGTAPESLGWRHEFHCGLRILVEVSEDWGQRQVYGSFVTDL